jgi:hypothetical protein
MKYAGTNYRDGIMQLVEEGLLTERNALLECLCYMSMDDNRRVYETIIQDIGIDLEEEPIIPMGVAQ